MYLRVYVVKAMPLHVEGIASGAHYVPVQLRLPFKASECLQLERATVPVAHQCRHVRLQDGVELGYTPVTPLVRVSLLREPQFVLHVLANPLSELGWQVLEHRVVLAIRILQPYIVRWH